MYASLQACRAAAALMVVLFHLGGRFGQPRSLPRYLFKRAVRIYPTYWLVCAAVCLAALESQIGRDVLPVDRRLVYGAIGSVLIVALVRAEEAGALVLKQRWLAVLGDSSYARYLLHIPIISVLCKGFVQLGATGPLALTAAFAFVVLACVGAPVLFHLAVERPMLARLSWRARKPVAAALTGVFTMPRP